MKFKQNYFYILLVAVAVGYFIWFLQTMMKTNNKHTTLPSQAR